MKRAAVSLKMTFRDGTAKRMREVLLERVVDTSRTVAEQMKAVLATHPDFCDEIEKTKEGHIPIALPKFHPELNPIEMVWAKLKRFTKALCGDIWGILFYFYTSSHL